MPKILLQIFSEHVRWEGIKSGDVFIVVVNFGDRQISDADYQCLNIGGRLRRIFANVIRIWRK